MYSNLKIDPSIKNRLDKLKKKKTYNEILEDIISYFELTGLDPRLDKTPPVDIFIKEMRKQGESLSERLISIIKIIRNIETTKIDVILKSINIDIASNESEELSITDQEVMDLINKNREQEFLINELNKKLKSSEIKNKEVIDKIKEYFHNPDLAKDGRGNFIISEIYIVNLINKIMNV